MKKTILIYFLSALLAGLLAVPAMAATVSVTATVNSSTGQVTISGAISSGANQQVTVVVESPDGAIDYLDQTKSGENGVYQFSYTLDENQKGTYQVSVGGTEVEQVAMTSFEFTGETAPSDPPSSGGSSKQVEDVEDKVQELEDGAQIRPHAKSLKKRMDEDGQIAIVYHLDQDTFDRAMNYLDSDEEGSNVIEIWIEKEDKVILDVSEEAVKAAIESGLDLVLDLQTPYGYYHLPISLLQDELSDNASLQIIVYPAGENILQHLQDQFDVNIHAAMHFEIEIEREGVTTQVSEFGRTFVERGIVFPGSVDAGSATAVIYLPDQNEIRFVPSLFLEEDDNTTAMIKRNGNSMYAIIDHEKTFDDSRSHWAREDIELLASKLIINGVSDSSFAPDDELTRAQFAALIVRSLGILESEATGTYRDVSEDAWYAAAVSAASEAGIVTGYADGTFRPDEKITREQITVMLARTLAYAEKAPDTDIRVLEKFKDRSEISDWAQSGVSTSVKAGIIQGVTSDSFAPDQYATRAQASVMIKRMLQYLDFIN